MIRSAVLLPALFAASALSAQTPAAAPATAAPAAVTPAADQLRCKRITDTGSLAHVTKVCHTRAEWEQLARDNQNAARTMIGSGRPGAQPQ